MIADSISTGDGSRCAVRWVVGGKVSFMKSAIGGKSGGAVGRSVTLHRHEHEHGNTARRTTNCHHRVHRALRELRCREQQATQTTNGLSPVPAMTHSLVGTSVQDPELRIV